uniref:ATP synthase complex subunit 8 n=1 Tax=Laeops lanceolata TaxID=1497103 RepID=A0A090ASS6_9PLEU|nr:ATP synthase F0 subunit 8 [Laeops lanceolata]YP_010485778.1 ATP synthase F0 subunit 8 [Laeops kitaharae]UVW81924.1 ATP synthase F0 subunit 8 [Laeops kitaharae]BAP58955.1 ATPase subunit 8 [Laeops lanceolata]
MPQLNPNPWFIILIFSWSVFLSIVPSKVLAHTTPNEPQTQDSATPQKATWNWPWY